MTTMELETVTKASEAGLTRRLAGIQLKRGTVSMVFWVKRVLDNKEVQRILVSWVLICTHHDLEVLK